MYSMIILSNKFEVCLMHTLCMGHTQLFNLAVFFFCLAFEIKFFFRSWCCLVELWYYMKKSKWKKINIYYCDKRVINKI